MEEPIKYSVDLTAYEYELLTENKMISGICTRQLESATEHDDGVELLLTLDQLEELTGFVAAESNHARSKRKGEELGEICDYLDAAVYRIKRFGMKSAYGDTLASVNGQGYPGIAPGGQA